MQVVLDVNVVISGLISAQGAPRTLLSRWRDGSFEIVVCPSWMDELRRALGYPKLRRYIEASEADELVGVLEGSAIHARQPVGPPPVRSRDPDDDYLLALAAQERVPIVSGDADLLALADRVPVFSARGFLEALEH